MSQPETINIEHLPVHILEKIFLDVPERKNLRLVSKNFKNIVESAKLYAKYELNVTKYLYDGSSSRITPRYQTLKFEELGMDHYKFIDSYETKWIKKIKLNINEGEIENHHTTIQHILFSFCNLEELIIQISGNETDQDLRVPQVIKFVENKNSKLTSLEISYNTYEDIDHFVEMFTEISSIKKFQIDAFCGEFPNTTWELEELRLIPEPLGEDNGYTMSVLSKQKPCLKVLVMQDYMNILNYVVRHFPKLESLQFNGYREERLKDDFLLPNDTLKKLTINDLNCDDDELLPTILQHYRNIEVLKIIDCDEAPKFSTKIKLHNLRKLILMWVDVILYISNIEMPNLKVLDIDVWPEEEGLEEVPIFMHVEHLTIQNMFKNSAMTYKFLVKFPVLRKLTIGYYCGKNIDIPFLINVCDAVQTLKQFEIDRRYLQLGASFQEFVSKCHEKNVKLYYYDYDYDSLKLW